MFKTNKELRDQISVYLSTMNPTISLAWLKRLTHCELLGLWLALVQIQDTDDLIRF